MDAQSGYDVEDIAASPRGESEIAGKYLEWAQKEAADGHRENAINALRRALDYADVSSDIPYLLAALEYNEVLVSRGQALINTNLAIGTDRWNYYSRNDAYLLKARLLVELMRYEEALRIISLMDESSEKELLRLKALFHSAQNALFRRAAERAMDLYPLDSEIASLVLQYAGSIEEYETSDDALLSVVLKRLPSLSEIDSNIIWRAVPFMLDIEEAARQLQAWLAVRRGSSGTADGAAIPKAALPVLLNLGVIDEDDATDALFTISIPDQQTIIDKDNLITVFNLLRTRPSRERFINTLSNYTGIIREDNNNDGIYESSCHYRSGLPVYYTNDTQQERSHKLIMEWKGGTPERAVITVPNQDGITTLADAPFFPHTWKIIVDYDIYPAVKKIQFREDEYYFRMDDFYYTPLIVKDLLFDDGILFPEINNRENNITLQTLFAFAYIIERPSGEFSNAVEQLKLLDGIVVSGRETLGGKIISETEFVRGRPSRQKVDLDLDGRFETLRFFKLDEEGKSEIDWTQNDWDGDGIYE
jgi:tetratricopeptide (TPR) repeat protein